MRMNGLHVKIANRLNLHEAHAQVVKEKGCKPMANFYRITKVRLINFHNFVNEIIEIQDGGHLFMLGDNGSGKTTVLDAIHYVLTAGESMEFNSAARVAGAKNNGGRSIHGVVMRYNIEKNGPMNPNGGTTYAAVEIAGRNGKPVSLAIGVSTHSMEESVERWGVIQECPVAELPLTHLVNGKVRVLTKSELRAALGGAGYYGQIGAYAEELASRFFKDRETFRDVCKFIATGKAYREIAARTNDYHQLFRELLQEPPREIFEEVIAHLKSLEESRLDLEKLRGRKRFVEQLDTLYRQVLQAKIHTLAARWAERHLAAQSFQSAFDQMHAFVQAEESRRLDLVDMAKRLETVLAEDELRLGELRHKDEQGLTVKVREYALSVARHQHDYEQAKRKLVVAQQDFQEKQEDVAKERDTLSKKATYFARALAKYGRDLPFSLSGVTALLEDAVKDAAPEQVLGTVSLREVRSAADERAQLLERDVVAAETRNEGLLKRKHAVEEEIREKEQRGEAVPQVKGFAQAQRAIQQQMLAAVPLYEGLVPAAGRAMRELAALEQLLGDALLATWVTDANHADAVRRIIFRDYPEQSIAVVTEETQPVHLEWLKQYIDFHASDPNAILVLQHLLNDKYGPHDEKFLGLSLLRFRLREVIMLDVSPRLLGEEIRRREVERELRTLEKMRVQIDRELRENKVELEQVLEQRRNVLALRTTLNELSEELVRLRDSVSEAVRCAVSAESAFINARENCHFHEEALQIAQEAHEDVLMAMRKAGIEGLQERVQELERRVAKRKAEREKHIKEIGSVEEKVDQLKRECEKMLKGQSEAQAERAAYQAEALTWITPDEPIDRYLLRCCEGDAQSRDALQQRAEKMREQAVVMAERIRGTVIQPEGIAFGFVYDEQAHALSDRRGRTLSDVLEETDRELREQEEVINEQTLKLFRQLVMDNLVGALQRQVIRLTEMAHRIERLLKQRTFGTNRYAFSVTPIESRKRLYELIRHYRSLDREKTEADLRAFIEDHAEEIKNSEVDEIPPVLDYRNWFRYELKVITSADDGLVMDRKIKSIGSGGEQAVPNYLLILTIAHFLYDKESIRLPILIFDEAFYGIDASRRDQLLALASDLELQLFVASPDQDGVKKEIPFSTSIFVVKDEQCHVHLYPYHWRAAPKQLDLLDEKQNHEGPVAFGAEL